MLCFTPPTSATETRLLSHSCQAGIVLGLMATPFSTCTSGQSWVSDPRIASASSSAIEADATSRPPSMRVASAPP
ncbi:hypothetical protein D3C86_1810470 [compost metagenome]